MKFQKQDMISSTLPLQVSTAGSGSGRRWYASVYKIFFNHVNEDSNFLKAFAYNLVF